jgi:hypothetical protein
VTIAAETLRAMIAEDDLGLLALPVKAHAMTKDQRLVASFNEITEFVREHGREPAKEGGDVSEMKLVFRLEGIRANDRQREELAPHDELALLHEPEPPASLKEAASDDPLGLLDDPAIDIFELRNVPKEPPAQPDRVAQRKPCEDFERFRPLFERCQEQLRTGTRKLATFRNEQEITDRTFYVLRGVLVYVAEQGEEQETGGRRNPRLRCIFENATEADLLLRSLASQLYRFGKQVTDPQEKTVAEVEDRLGAALAGRVYVLRSLSEDPQLAAFPDLHKIGSTTQGTKSRLAGAESHTTFLGAGVEEVVSFEMPAAISQKVEGLLHRFFSAVRLDAWFEREGVPVADVREWFDVPLAAIEQAVELIASDGIQNYEYDAETRGIVLRS